MRPRRWPRQSVRASDVTELHSAVKILRKTGSNFNRRGERQGEDEMSKRPTVAELFREMELSDLVGIETLERLIHELCLKGNRRHAMYSHILQSFHDNDPIHWIPSTSTDKAREIMGDNFISVDEARQLMRSRPCEIDVQLGTVPFSKEILESCRNDFVLFPGFSETKDAEGLKKVNFLRLQQLYPKMFKEDNTGRPALPSYPADYIVFDRWYLIRKRQNCAIHVTAEEIADGAVDKRLKSWGRIETALVYAYMIFLLMMRKRSRGEDIGSWSYGDVWLLAKKYAMVGNVILSYYGLGGTMSFNEDTGVVDMKRHYRDGFKFSVLESIVPDATEYLGNR